VTSHPGQHTSERGHLSIREVLDLLVAEFPDITISKIRFLESRGLISPERTPSGYRKFYEDDVDRLRWILRQQREHFLPLKVIKGRLDSERGLPAEVSLFEATASPVPAAASRDVDAASNFALAGAPQQRATPHVTNGVASTTAARESAGELPATETHVAAPLAAATSSSAAPTADGPSSITPDASPEMPTHEPDTESEAVAEAEAETAAVAKQPTPPADASPGTASVGLTAEELASLAGGDLALVRSLEEFGLIEALAEAGARRYPPSSLEVARCAISFARFGIEPRHLRTFKHAAERETSLFHQVVVTLLAQNTTESRARAGEQFAELIALGEELQGVFARRTIAGLLDG
jgi:DNA-binding transcriptional MerR regulator